LLKQPWLEGGGVYGYRKTHQDLLELGEARSCRSLILQRRAAIWVTEITSSGLFEGWFYPATMYSRRVVASMNHLENC
jgi:hypothetical protein